MRFVVVCGTTRYGLRLRAQTGHPGAAWTCEPEIVANGICAMNGIKGAERALAVSAFGPVGARGCIDFGGLRPPITRIGETDLGSLGLR